jgi:capsular polysaccharide biosynthesis protein
LGDHLEELDLRDIIHIIQKRFWIIVTLTILAALLVGTISAFFLDDIYASSTTLIVSKQKENSNINDLQLNDINLSRNLVDTYSVIIKSDRVLEKVLKEVNLALPIGELRSKIDVNPENNTEIIRITIEDTNPEIARDIANSVARVFMNEVTTLLRMDNVQVIDLAKASPSPVKPNVKMNTLIAAMVGLMAGIGIAFLIEMLDNTIKTPEDVQKYMDIPVIGIIPDFGE